MNLSTLKISSTHGFCPAEPCLRHLAGLEKHISYLLDLPLGPLSAITSLPQYKPVSLSEHETEFAFLVHTSLNSILNSHYQLEKIPCNLSIPTIELSNFLNRPPMLSLVSIQYHNWSYLSNSQSFHPDNLQNFISFSRSRDEDYFFSVANYIEYLGAPALLEVLSLPALYQSPAQLKASLQKISSSVSKMTSALDLLFHHIDPKKFYFGFRHYLKSFSKIEFEGTGVAFDRLMGPSAVQSPLLKLLDSFIGMNKMTEFLIETEKYMKTEHRQVLEIVRKRDLNQLKMAVLGNSCENEFNEVVGEIVKFRKKHIQVADHFVTRQAADSNAVGTAGSPLQAFLIRSLEKTEKMLLSKN